MGIETGRGVPREHIWKKYLGETQTFKEGDSIRLFESKRFYIVREGLVAVTDDKDRVIRAVKPGIIFGFENFDRELPSENSSNDIPEIHAKVLTENAVVQAIDIDMTDIDAMLLLHQIIARTAKIQERRQASATATHAPQRTAQALLDTALISPSTNLPTVPLTQGEIGEVAHVSREIVNTHLGRLRTQKIVAPGKEEVTILDVPELRKKANKL